MSARAWVSGSTLAKAASAAGIAPIGKSEPAKNHGTIATAGSGADVLLLRRDAVGERLGRRRTSPTAKPTPAATNQRDPGGRARGSRRRAGTAAPISTASCRPLTASATARLPSTSSGRGTGRREQVAAGAAVAVDDDADARRTCS